MRCFERQPGEGTKAFEAYKVFRDLGSGRTLREVATALYGEGYREGTRRVPGRIKKWSTDFDWVGRVQAMEDHHEMIRRDAVEQHERSQATDRAARVEALRELNLANEERAAALTATLLDRVDQLLDELPLVTKTVVAVENGVPVTYVMQPATKNAVLDAARLHKIATRNELAKVDLKTYDLTKATDEQLDRIIAGEDPAKVLGDGV
jgi:hypothetical protein